MNITQPHPNEDGYRVEFACYFQDNPDIVELVEVSPEVLDPGDEEFYAVSLATPRTVPGVGHVRITLITPGEFNRARESPDSPGGRLLRRLQREQNYHILVGASTPYAQELACAAR